MGEAIIRLNSVNSAVSGRYILGGREDGALPSFEIVTVPVNDHHHENRVIDWGGKDIYIKKLHAAFNKMLSHLGSDADISSLRAKAQWSKDDRDSWENKLFSAAQKVVDADEFFNYRAEKTQVVEAMNKLKPGSHFVCVEQSITALAMVQAAEFRLLQKTPGLNGAGNYYMVIGKLGADEKSEHIMRHTFIISETTANLFDPTNKRIAVPLRNNMNFSRFVAEGTLVCGPYDNEDNKNNNIFIYSTGSKANSQPSQNPFWDTPREYLGPIAPPLSWVSPGNKNNGKITLMR